MASDDSKKEVNNIDDAGYHLMFDDVTMSSAQSAIEVLPLPKPGVKIIDLNGGSAPIG